MSLKDDLIKKIESKPTWGTVSVKSFLDELEYIIARGLAEATTQDAYITPHSFQKKKVDQIKRGDVLVCKTMALVHPVLVWKVAADRVYGLVVTSNPNHCTIHQVEKDRFLQGSYVTNTIVCYEYEKALCDFAYKFENAREVSAIFDKVKDFYSKQIKLIR